MGAADDFTAVDRGRIAVDEVRLDLSNRGLYVSRGGYGGATVGVYLGPGELTEARFRGLAGACDIAVT